MPTRRRILFHERRIQLHALLAGLPAVAVALWLLWLEPHSPKVQWTFSVIVVLAWLGFSAGVREQVASPLRTLANVLEAMREGDYSIRARNADNEEALGEVMLQVNAIGATMQAQRLGAIEATALLRKVMEEINVAVFTFDQNERLKFVNRAGERLLQQPAERLLDHTAEELDLRDMVRGADPTVQRAFAGGSGRWGVHRSNFREEGRPLRLIVLTDVTRALREEELLAWQRIVRVLGHELNNSLTPIKSIAGSLGQIVKRDELPEDWRDDLRRGLDIIAARSDSLSRFMGAYARLAKLPRPTKSLIPLPSMIEHVARVETRMPVEVIPGPGLTIEADGDQLEQALINLVRNAVDATRETGGRVSMTWEEGAGQVAIRILDEGPGLANTNNLFVPFFTTKPGGSGIGLVLSRQIAEAHGGSLTLENRVPGPGCEARIVLPA
jgi:two-component system nitrogen regulation sensor histidine kinase NtrY